MVMYNIKIRLGDVYLVAVGKGTFCFFASEVDLDTGSPKRFFATWCFSTRGEESDGR